MTTPEPLPAPLPRARDVLGSPEPASRSGVRGRGRGLAVALVAAGVLEVAGGAVVVAGFLAGGGAQPEDALPAGVLGMVKLDLDPAAGQKLAAYRLLERFPSTAASVQDADSVKDDLLSDLLGDADGLDYAEDVKPWIGDRAGVALLPAGDQPAPLAAVAYTDRAGAEKGLRRVAAEAGDTFFAFSENADFVLIGPIQEVVDEAATAQEVLANDDSWRKGMAALDGDQIVTGWADLSRLMELLPQESREQAAQVYGLGGDLGLSGTFVMGAHAGEGHVELVARTVDLRSSVQATTAVGGSPSSGLLTGLPADTLAALSVTDLGPGVAEAFRTAYSAQDPLGLIAYAAQLGIALPDDLAALLGQDIAVAAFPDGGFGARSRTEQVDAAFGTASAVAEALLGAASPDVLRRLEDGVAVGTDPAALDAVTSSDGGLGGTAAFRAAVPEAEGAGILLYVDIAGALARFGDPAELDEELSQLQSLGVSSRRDARNATARFRLTLRD